MEDQIIDSVNKLKFYLSNCNQAVNENKLVVDKFLKHFKSSWNKARYVFLNASTEFMGVGSSYENTNISPEAAFDIAMILPHPYLFKNFKVIQTEEVNLYALQCTSRKKFVGNKFINEVHFLNTEYLKMKVLSELGEAIENINFGRYTIRYRTLPSTFSIRLSEGEKCIQVNIVPHIKAKVENIPSWSEETLPMVLKDYIKSPTTCKHIVLLNLSCPRHKMKGYYPQVVHPRIGLLEKEAFLKSETVSTSLCIAKFLSEYYGWSAKGLRSFHLKHVALQVYDDIHSKEDPLLGNAHILNKLVCMLQNGRIDSCFIQNHNIIYQSERECKILANDIKMAYESSSPDQILVFLEHIENRVSSITASLNLSSGHEITNIPLLLESKPLESTKQPEEPFSYFSNSEKEVKYNEPCPSSNSTITKPKAKLRVDGDYIRNTGCNNSYNTASEKISSVHEITNTPLPLESKPLESTKQPEEPFSYFSFTEKEVKYNEPCPSSNSTITKPSAHEIMNTSLPLESKTLDCTKPLDKKYSLFGFVGEENEDNQISPILPKDSCLTPTSNTTTKEPKFIFSKVAPSKTFDDNLKMFKNLYSSGNINNFNKSSTYLYDLQYAANYLVVDEDNVRNHFNENFATLMAEVLNQKQISLDMLGKYADHQISEIQTMDVSISDINHTAAPLSSVQDHQLYSVICSDHIKFGQEAATCDINCQWPD